MRGHSPPLRALFLAFALLSVGSVPRAAAQIPPVPSSLLYQGHLAKPGGTPVANGLYNLRFSLWTSPLEGTQTWSQTSDNVPANNGQFAVSFSGITAQTFAQDSYLEIQIGSTTLGRRQRLKTVANAFKAERVADGAIQYRSIADGAITLPNLAADAIDTPRWLLGGNAARPGAFLGTTNFAGAVMGGQRNDGRTEAAVAGGSDNWARGQYASVGGGGANVATGLYGAVPGGLYARAAGDFAFAGGAVERLNASGQSPRRLCNPRGISFSGKTAFAGGRTRSGTPMQTGTFCAGSQRRKLNGCSTIW